MQSLVRRLDSDMANAGHCQERRHRAVCGGFGVPGAAGAAGPAAPLDRTYLKLNRDRNKEKRQEPRC